MAEPVQRYPDVAASKTWSVKEQKSLQRITTVEQMRTQEMLQRQPFQTGRKMVDDWFTLLDVVPRKTGIMERTQSFMLTFVTLLGQSTSLFGFFNQSLWLL